jgi:hypothetical protein
MPTMNEVGPVLVRSAIGVARAWAERWRVGVCDVRAVSVRPGGGPARGSWGAEAWGPRGEVAGVAPYRGPMEALGALMDRADNDVTKEGA